MNPTTTGLGSLANLLPAAGSQLPGTDRLTPLNTSASNASGSNPVAAALAKRIHEGDMLLDRLARLGLDSQYKNSEFGSPDSDELTVDSEENGSSSRYDDAMSPEEGMVEDGYGDADAGDVPVDPGSAQPPRERRDFLPPMPALPELPPGPANPEHPGHAVPAVTPATGRRPADTTTASGRVAAATHPDDFRRNVVHGRRLEIEGFYVNEGRQYDYSRTVTSIITPEEFLSYVTGPDKGHDFQYHTQPPLIGHMGVTTSFIHYKVSGRNGNHIFMVRQDDGQIKRWYFKKWDTQEYTTDDGATWLRNPRATPYPEEWQERRTQLNAFRNRAITNNRGGLQHERQNPQHYRGTVNGEIRMAGSGRDRRQEPDED